MPCPSSARVDEVGIAAVRLANGAVEPMRILRHRDEMHMVGHEAVDPYFDARFSRLLSQKIAIDVLIAGLEEDGLAAVAPLRDVMWAAGKDDAGAACHGAKARRNLFV
jgi:hypothetical protein